MPLPAPLAAGASAIARDGSYWDHLRPYSYSGEGVLVSRAGADERPGAYRIEVAHQGYATAVLSNIRVDADRCHVQTRHVTIALTPAA